MVESHFENLTSYKNRNGGLWGRGDMFVYSNVKLADNAIGMTHAAGDIGSEPFQARLVDSLFVGETDNIGNPTTPEEMAYGRSLPKKRIPDFPIRGFEYYDYRDDVVNTTFVNFQDNDRRKTGALSFLLYTSAGSVPEAPSAVRNSSTPSRCISRNSIPGSIMITAVATHIGPCRSTTWTVR